MSLTPEQDNKIIKLSESAHHYLKSQYGSVKGRFGQEGFSGDAANLYTLISLDGNFVLVKVAWGEFSAAVFKDWSKSPYRENTERFQAIAKKMPLYCVGQWSSYLADPAVIQFAGENPVEYLARYSVFMVRPPGTSECVTLPPAPYSAEGIGWRGQVRGDSDSLTKWVDKISASAIDYETALSFIATLQQNVDNKFPSLEVPPPADGDPPGI